jgi:addiction module HigA family antidote
MNEKDKLKPVHPGEVLQEEFLKPLGLSQNRLALAIRVPACRISEIIHGSVVSPQTQLFAWRAISRCRPNSGWDYKWITI